MDEPQPPSPTSPFAIRNVRLFILFRIFFNARYYYPVFTILFLDYGLTIEQFALLNVAWAVSIVVLEVPSGALADTIGRRNLLVATGVLMVAEMALITFAPLGNPTLLFAIFLANRILSGAAEAAASGADEALAYDSLVREGNPDDWGRVLERQMRLQSAAFIFAMTLGAAVYDPALMNRAAGWLGIEVHFTQAMTLRIPPFLTLLMALATLGITLRMREVAAGDPEACAEADGCAATLIDAFRVTLRAGKWILRTPFALVLILFALLYDHTVRMLLTLSSEYYRLISLPEAAFGLIGSGMAAVGLFMPRISLALATRRTPLFNMILLSVLTLAGLIGMTRFIPHYGLLFMVLLYGVISMTHFFLSHYLNRITASGRRATVLSFKGLSYNLAYGLIGVLYAGVSGSVREKITAAHPDMGRAAADAAVFRETMGWFPLYFLGFFAIVAVISRLRLGDSRQHRRKG